jgi:hypothetical protein
VTAIEFTNATMAHLTTRPVIAKPACRDNNPYIATRTGYYFVLDWDPSATASTSPKILPESVFLVAHIDKKKQRAAIASCTL